MTVGRFLMIGALGAVLVMATGCVSVSAPKEIRVGGGGEPIDSSEVPRTASHSECRDELTRAYSHIRYLERKAAEYKRERDEYEDELEECEERLEDMED